MIKGKVFTILGAVLGCALVLVACRAEEQGRITRYKPGVYMGKKDTQLGEVMADELKQRAATQGDTNYRVVGGGPQKTGVDTGALGVRTQKQGGSTP